MPVAGVASPIGAESETDDQERSDDNVGEAHGRFAEAGEAVRTGEGSRGSRSAARDQAKADVEKSADEARAKAEAHAEELQRSATATGAHISASWNDLQKSWGNHMAQVRQSIDDKKDQRDARRAEARADDAEADALFAIDYAYATVEEAEYAVLDAISARMEAEDRAMAT